MNRKKTVIWVNSPEEEGEVEGMQCTTQVKYLGVKMGMGAVDEIWREEQEEGGEAGRDERGWRVGSGSGGWARRGEGQQRREGMRAIYEGLCERQWGAGEEWLGWMKLWWHRMQGGLQMWIWKVWKGGILARRQMKEKWGIGDGKCVWCGEEEMVQHVVRECEMTKRWTVTWTAVAGVGMGEVDRWQDEDSRGDAISEMVVVVWWMGV